MCHPESMSNTTKAAYDMQYGTFIVAGNMNGYEYGYEKSQPITSEGYTI